jgi:hypothetical protein
MSFKRIIIARCLFAGAAMADSMVTYYSYVFDYTFPQPSVQGVVSDVGRPIRIDVQVVGGDSSPLDIDGATLQAAVISGDDNRINQVASVVAVNGTNGQYLITVTPILDGTAQIKVDAYDTDTGSYIAMVGQFDLTVTSTPAQASVINITNINEITLGSVTVGVDIAEGAISVVVTSSAASLSLFPLIASNGSLGLVDFPWGQIHSVTGTFGTLNIGDLNVEGSVTAADTGAVKLVGSTMTGGLTNEAGFFGDGAGLTNLPAGDFVANLDGVATNLNVVKLSGPPGHALNFLDGSAEIAHTNTIRIDVGGGALYIENGPARLSWGNRVLYGPWTIDHDATNEAEIVNWRTMTGHTAGIIGSSGATQAIATVGGSTVTSAYDEATATLSWSNSAAGGLALWSEGTGTAHQIGTEWLPPGSSASDNFLGFTIYTNLAVSMRRANPFTAALGEGARDMQATWNSQGINTTNHVALGAASTISGGFRNQAGGNATTIGGGGNNSTPGQYQTIGGGDANTFTLSTASWGYIGGGANNLVAPASQYSAIMAGRQNTIESTGSGNYHTMGGGRQNAIAVDTVGYSVLMGGYLNRAGGGYAVIGGGVLNVVTGNQGVILGGRTNVVVGEFGMIPGGRSNRVAGAFGFAGGESAKVEHNGAFVWSSFPQLTASTATNEFVIGSERVRVNWAGGEVVITPTSIAMGGHTMTVVTNGGYIFIGVAE